VVFYWAGAIMDAWLATIRLLTRPARLWTLASQVWRALPGDALGLLAMRACRIDGPTRVLVLDGVEVHAVEDPRAGRLLDHQTMPIRAQTLGRYVFARGPLPEHTLRHEVEHIRQWRRFGPLYLAIYFGASALLVLRRKRPYWDNPFEVAARARADREMATRRDGGTD
jgi:hypothetical protein